MNITTIAKMVLSFQAMWIKTEKLLGLLPAKPYFPDGVLSGKTKTLLFCE